MRRQATVGALLLIAVGIVLGATVFRTDIAQATGLDKAATNVIVKNTPAQAVPVQEQNAPISGGGGSFQCSPGAGLSKSCAVDPPAVASALVIEMSGGVVDCVLRSNGQTVIDFSGPIEVGPSGPRTLVVPLSRPITFDTVSTDVDTSSDQCVVNWVGNSP